MFVQETNAKICSLRVPAGSVWNTDQSGLKYEIAGARTLSLQGERITFGLAQSENAMTHSYTIQVMMAMDGTLAS